MICLLVGLAVGGPVAVVLVLSAIALWRLLCEARVIATEVIRSRAALVRERWLGQKDAPTRRRREPAGTLRANERRLKRMLALCLACGLTPIMTSVLLGIGVGDSTRTAFVLGAALLVVAATGGVLRQVELNRVYRAASLRPLELTSREKVLDEQQAHPCVIYRRPEQRADDDPLAIALLDDVPSPFIGSGELVNRWLPPMTVQLLREGDGPMRQLEYETPPFASHDLVEALRTALSQLSAEQGPGGIRDLRVVDRVYLAEADVSSDRTFLRTTLNQLDLWRVIDDPHTTAHHFLETTVPLEGGELVVAIFIRVSVKGRTLSLDVATSALTRTPPEFQVINDYAEHGSGAVFRSALRSVLHLPDEVGRVWQLAKAPMVLARGWHATKDRSLVPRRGVKVGARIAIRSEYAEEWQHAQLDKSTIYDHMKIIEQRILKTTEDFLSDHEVDTSVFKKQATNIINSGVLNMGGKTEVFGSAVGTNAQLHQNVDGQVETEGTAA